MKYLALVMAFTLSTALTQAQSPSVDQGHPRITTTQRAEIKSKKLALQLDLSEKQQQQVMEIEKEFLARKEALKEEAKQKGVVINRENKPNIPGRDKTRRKHTLPPELHIKMLDLQLAHQEEIKKVLSEVQYSQWKNTRHQQRRDRHRGHAKSPHRPGRK